MKRKKIISILIVILTIGLLAMSFWAENVPLTQNYISKKKFSETETLYVRRATKSEDKIGYAINNPQNGSSGGAQTIWNLLTMKAGDADSYYLKTEEGYKTLYCLDITKWMGNVDSNEATSNTVTYNRKYNMDTEGTEIQALYPTLGATLDEINNYHALLWLMDNIYIPNNDFYINNAEEKKKDKLALLANAGIQYEPEINGYTYFNSDGTLREILDEKELLTDDDIEAVQQAVIWRYTLNESSNDQTKQTLRPDIQTKNVMFHYTEDGTSYQPLSNIKCSIDGSTGFPARDEQANILYKYLTIQADKYGKENYTSKKEIPIEVSKEGLTLGVNNNYYAKVKQIEEGYLVGPIKIDKTAETPSEAKIEITDNENSEITNYYYANEEGESLGENKTINDLVGKGDFYITIPDKSIDLIKMKIITQARITEKNLWCNKDTNEYQPIAEPVVTEMISEINIMAKPEIKGNYDIVLVKEDAQGEQLNSQATFEVNGEEKTVIGKLEIAKDVEITEQNAQKPDTYVIKELVPPDEYCKFNGIINLTVTKKKENGAYKIDEVNYTVTDEEGNDQTDQVGNKVEVYLNEDGNLYVEVKNYQFDLKLVKRIVEVNGNKVPERIKKVDIKQLAEEKTTTANYDLDKTPVEVKKGDIVKYTLRVYNEGEIDGYAEEITEDIPKGLEFMWSDKIGSELENDESLTKEEKEAIKYNQVVWKTQAKEETQKDIQNEGEKTEETEESKDEPTKEEITTVTTNYLGKGKGVESVTKGSNLIKAFDPNQEYQDETNKKNPDYKEVSIYLRVTEEAPVGEIITNEAAITQDKDSEGNEVDDRDSDTEKWVKHEDDEDYDNIVIPKPQIFDLALRKWVTEAIVIENGQEKVTLTGHKPEDDPEQVVKVELDRKNLKNIQVKFKYSIRITNEGEIAGYAKEITDYIPEGLKFVAAENPDWTEKQTNIITTRKLENTLLQPGESADVEVLLTWINNSENMGLKVNLAEISEDYNEENVPDIDSTPNNKKMGEDDIDDAPVLLSVTTGQARLYLTLTFTILMTLASGIMIIKKFVL
ncbi:MAG: Cys-Gln thioester bond-forming surface protein [Clostridia bacterium]|nr:Cys-Gln thioester bond-forming surface protein [Clostridia bacterium]